MVSDNHALITTVMSEVFGKNTLTKTPSIIGHRGNPSQAPENSIEGYLTAVQNGATEVETDIYLTKDGEIIIMHDNTLNRTTNYTGTKTVPQMTLEEIREYRLLNKDGSVSDSPVPTLKEMFEALKDTDVYYVIELKSGDETMVPVLYDLIKEYNVQHRVNIISFSGPVLKKTYDVDPIISAGYLSGSLTATAADMEALRINVFQLIKGAQVYNASVNINHANISKEFYTMLNDRGVTLWPWTFQTGTSMAFYNEFLWGVDGLTTDDAQLTKNTVMDFNVDKVGANTMAPGNTMEIKAEITTYGRVTSQAEGVNVVWLTENMGASYDPATGIFTAGSAEGKVAFMLSYSAKLPNGKQYVLYSQPVTVDIVAEPVEESVDVFKIACLSIIAVCSIATVVVLATGKKKKD
jgi:glycerophosphoryl diester phosphodiesterase